MKEKNLVEEKPEEAFSSRKDNSFLPLNCYNKEMSKLNILVAGSTGYIGVQLIKLLISHKKINIKYLCGKTSIGKKISLYDNSLKKIKLPKVVKFNKKYLVRKSIIKILRLVIKKLKLENFLTTYFPHYICIS